MFALAWMLQQHTNSKTIVIFILFTIGHQGSFILHEPLYKIK